MKQETYQRHQSSRLNHQTALAELSKAETGPQVGTPRSSMVRSSGDMI